MRHFTNILSLIALSFLSQAVLGQDFNHSNSLERIDSLTLQYMQKSFKKEINYSSIDGFSPKDGALFNSQMNGLGSEINFDYNEYVYGQMQYFSYANGAFLRRAYVNKSKYFSIFEETLDKKGLPQELKYISIIESALNPTARSRAGAMGLWQFMPGTGRYLHMTINRSIDDRKSIVKSTEHAADYFKTLYNMFDDWLLAIAAYNAGPGNVRKAISAAGGVGDFWYIKKYLPRETQNYVPRFIAAAYLMNYSSTITQTETPKDAVYCSININDTLEFEELCRYTGLPSEDLSLLNAQYRYKKLRGHENRTYELLLPYTAAMTFLEKKDSIFYFSKNPYPVIYDSFDSFRNDSLKKVAAIQKAQKPKNIYHYVKRGETLTYLARKYRVSVGDIKRWNHKSSSNLRIGERILIKRKV